MLLKRISALAALTLAGCGNGAPQYVSQAIERLEYAYISAFQDHAGSKKCLPPKQLDGKQWMTLCGFNEGGGRLSSGGLWEVREEAGGWAAYASNGKAAAAQTRFTDPQIRPPEAPPKFDTSKARSLFPE